MIDSRIWESDADADADAETETDEDQDFKEFLSLKRYFGLESSGLWLVPVKGFGLILSSVKINLFEKGLGRFEVALGVLFLIFCDLF